MKAKTIAQTNPHWLCFSALLLFYVAFAPGTVEGMGYVQENLLATDRLAGNLGRWMTGQRSEPFLWTRHGGVEPMIELPFALLSRLLFGASVKWLGRVMVFLPILQTALLCLLIFLWTRRLTGNVAWGRVLALAAGVSTMLWPYAYIGLETTQSLFLFGAAYLALARTSGRGWAETILFALASAVAVSVKLNGVFLVPAVVFLVWSYFRGAPSRGRTIKAALAALVIVAVYGLNLWLRQQAWSGAPGGDVGYALGLVVDHPLTAALHAFSYFGSPNKSLLIYAPVTGLSLLALPRAYRAHPRVVIFAALTLAGLVGGFSALYMWAEETWGPRYPHAAIAPLVISFAAARAAVPFHWRREVPLLAAMSIGTAVSFLGAFFYYGILHNAAIDSSQATLETIQHDPRWNHARFNLKLLQVWRSQRSGREGEAEQWPPPPHWWFERPADAPPDKTVDLRELAVPQPVLFQEWRPAFPVPYKTFQLIRAANLICLIGSVILGVYPHQYFDKE
jgi:hypothetical protein